MSDPGLTWIRRAADDAVEHARQTGATSIVCASGVSPSGPVHLGNLREVMTAHFVADELQRRGIDAVHLHSWDDYDRLRKVPAGLDSGLAEHIGKPLSQAPDPCGSHDSYASHFIAEFSAALCSLGVSVREVRQSEQYRNGAYNAAIRRAMERRGEIFDIMVGFRTDPPQGDRRDAARAAYYPFKPYCRTCRRDFTSVVWYADDVVCYVCRCGAEDEMTLADGELISGKLAWKIDWPMRWATETVVFESAGEDHHAPNSSYAAGTVLVREVFGGTAPYSFPYSFVGLAGGSHKMSGSAGGAATPGMALDFLEPSIVRWLYARRLPGQSFTIDLSPSAVLRLYDEWDHLSDRVSSGVSDPAEEHLYQACVRTSKEEVDRSRFRVPFRLMASVVDITQENPAQMDRVVRQYLPGAELPPQREELARQLSPRLDCAINYATRLVPAESRTVVRASFNHEAWATFDDRVRAGVRLLLRRLEDDWTIDGLTKLVYAIPKLSVGLPEDAAPSPELKTVQRRYFAALYNLLCSADTGPRLPTLLMSVGAPRVRELLTEV